MAEMGEPLINANPSTAGFTVGSSSDSIQQSSLQAALAVDETVSNCCTTLHLR